METLMVDIQEVLMKVILLVAMEVILQEVLMEAILGLATMMASMEAILRETSMVDIMGVLQTAEDQIVDQHSMENLVIQARPVGSTVGITVVIQMA